MTTCESCGKEIREGEHVIVVVNAIYHQKTEVMHALDVYRECGITHMYCGSME